MIDDPNYTRLEVEETIWSDKISDITDFSGDIITTISNLQSLYNDYISKYIRIEIDIDQYYEDITLSFNGYRLEYDDEYSKRIEKSKKAKAIAAEVKRIKEEAKILALSKPRKAEFTIPPYVTDKEIKAVIEQLRKNKEDDTSI